MNVYSRPTRAWSRSVRRGRSRVARLWGSRFTIGILAGAFAVGIAPPGHAQSLNDQMVLQLQGNCNALGFPDPNSGFAPQGTASFGPQLTAICNSAQGIQNPSGGGAASPQAGTLSLQNNFVVQQRLERAKNKKKQDAAGAPATSTPFRGRSGSPPSATSDDAVSSVSSHGFNIFISGTYASVDQNLTPFEDSYTSSITGGALGIDYQFNDIVVAGLVTAYRKQDATYGGGGGDFTMEAFEPALYVSVLPSPSTFLQFVAGYGSQDSDVDRNVSVTLTNDPANPIAGPVASSTDTNAYRGGAQFGYDHTSGRFTFGPRIGVNYNRDTIDPYTETGTTGLELRVQERTVKSLQGVVSFYGGWAISTKSAVVVPQFNVDYVHEFEDQASIVSAQFAQDLRDSDGDPTTTAVTFPYQTNVPDSDFFNVGAGVGVVFAHGIQLFVNLRTMLENTNFDSSSGTIGLRFEL